MRLGAYSAVLTHAPPSLRALSGVRTVAPAEPMHQRSAAASYAIAAIESMEARPTQPALYCIGGPVGSSLHLFDGATRGSADGRLLGDGFSQRRHRRIHPFTLLLSLPNQVAATLSLHFDWKGPCCNTIASPTVFADLLPIIEKEAERHACLIVMSSAAGRAEDRSWYRHHQGDGAIIEGAIVLLFERHGELGNVGTCASSTGRGAAVRESTAGEPPLAPGLEAGLRVLEALALPPAARVELPSTHRITYFERHP